MCVCVCVGLYPMLFKHLNSDWFRANHVTSFSVGTTSVKWPSSFLCSFSSFISLLKVTQFYQQAELRWAKLGNSQITETDLRQLCWPIFWQLIFRQLIIQQLILWQLMFWHLIFLQLIFNKIIFSTFSNEKLFLNFISTKKFFSFFWTTVFYNFFFITIFWALLSRNKAWFSADHVTNFSLRAKSVNWPSSTLSSFLG